MKEHPILFTGPMVKAILDGSKTQTRRIIKGLIKPDDPPCNIRKFDGDFQQYGAGGVWLRLGCPYGQPGDTSFTRWRDREPPGAGIYEIIWEPGYTPVLVKLNPEFGWTWAELPDGDPEAIELDIEEPGEIRWRKPGDRLWVRETWSPMWSTDCNNCDGDPEFLDENGHCEHFYVEYRADTGHSRPGDWPDPEPNGDYADAPAWKPSIHMFRWASRITLEVTDVRVERVQDISRADVHAEGTPGMVCGKYQCRNCNGSGSNHTWPQGCPHCEPKGSGLNHTNHFRKLWDSSNAKRGYGWDVNPWCWVVGFKLIEDKTKEA
jgi:hypothetical protein